MQKLIDHRPPRIAMTFVLVAVAANVLMPLPVHPALPAAAGITGLLGFTLMMRAWWLFKVAQTAICPTRQSTVLVTHDVFSVSRNPMYLGMLLMLVGIAMALGGMAYYIAAIAYGVVISRVFCPYEEQKALDEFGEPYAAYTRRVRRWL
jgi:protein-S-isoprenylcysteine O-methyltransferase Ste14